MFKTIIGAAALLCNTLLYCGATLAQDIYPNKPIKIVLGVAAGASTDFLAREVGRGLSERLKVPVVIENKAGANTIIGTNAVAKAAPDGYSLYLTTITTAINPFIYTNLPFDFKKDMRAPLQIKPQDNGLMRDNPTGKERQGFANAVPLLGCHHAGHGIDKSAESQQNHSHCLEAGITHHDRALSFKQKRRQSGQRLPRCKRSMN